MGSSYIGTYIWAVKKDNVHKNYELLYTSLALITIELANEKK